MNRKHIAAVSCLISLIAATSQHAFGITYNVPPDPFPSTLNAGDILNISGSASLPGGFNAASGSQINLLAGATLDFLFTTANVHLALGSSIAGPFGITGGSLVSDGGNLNGISNIGGGAHAEILSGDIRGFFGGLATIDLRGGAIGGIFYEDTTLNMFGGALTGSMQFVDSFVNVHGGTIPNGPSFGWGMDRGEFHFFMRNALVDGAPIPGLVMGATATIPGRNVTLSGQMENGAPLNYVIRARNALVGISAQTTVKVSLVPEPACYALLSVGVAMLGARRRKLSTRG
jgi:hypothetical protein